jgi:hypothetical protein
MAEPDKSTTHERETEARLSESRRILDRVAGEGDALGTGMAARAARRAREHLTARDADQKDRIELWGTRIARTIGVAFLLALAVWFLLPALQPA